MLTDERIGGASTPLAAGDAADDDALVARYSQAARYERQRRITDLAPRRIRSIALFVAAGAGAIAGILALFAWRPDVAAFDLASRGSLADAFLASILALTAACALLVYTVRRHQLDDYRARYRIWKWAALAALLASLDHTSRLHESLQLLLVEAAGSPILGEGAIWWAGPFALFAGYVALRLLMDVRECRTSLAMYLAAAACFALPILDQFGGLPIENAAHRVMAACGGAMTGGLLLLLATVVHARYVMLDANGLLPPRRKRSPRPVADAKKTEPEAGSASQTAPHAGAKKRSDLEPVARTASTVAEEAAEAYEDSVAEKAERRRRREKRPTYRVDEPETPTAARKLSKAERKAMRRQKEQERREGLR